MNETIGELRLEARTGGAMRFRRCPQAAGCERTRVVWHPASGARASKPPLISLVLKSDFIENGCSMKKPQTSKIFCVARLLLLLPFLVQPLMVQAQYRFTTNSDGSLNIAQYTGPGGAVVIPNTTNGLPITSIGDAAFFGNTNLTSVTVGTNVASIADQAFSYSSVTNVTLPGSVTNIAFDSFHNCNSLTAITVATNNPAYSSAAGVLFNQNQTTLIGFPEGKAGSYAVPDSVTNIGVYAFFDSTNLTSVALSSNVSTIEDYAFYDCPGLTAITVNTNNLWYSSVAGVFYSTRARPRLSNILRATRRPPIPCPTPSRTSGWRHSMAVPI